MTTTVNYKLMGKPREYEQQETVSCVIPSCKVLEPTRVLPYITVGVQTYDDSGKEITTILIVPQKEQEVSILKDSHVEWYKKEGVFKTDVLEEIWQNWKSTSSPDDELENFEFEDVDRVCVEYPSHLSYSEQVTKATELLKNYLFEE